MKDTLYIVVPCYNEEAVIDETTKRLTEKLKNLIITERISEKSRILYVNDGSKDKTREIIKRFALEDDRITFINPDQTENLGVIKSFFTLLKYQESDYYLFSDQDDNWLPEKLSLQLEEASR